MSTTVFSGKLTPRYSIAEVVMRAVNGVIGSKRSASSVTFGASSRGRSRSSCHWSGCVGEQPHRVRELALAGVDAAKQDAEDQVAELVVVQFVAGLLGLDQVRDQVVPGLGAAVLDQPVDVGVTVDDAAFDLASAHRGS